METMTWRKCNACRKPIAYRKKFWVCNVSTCNRRRVGLHFCSVECYDSHLPDMNHRESWAIEVQAPSEEEWKKYAADQGDDAVWPPSAKAKKTEEAPTTAFVNPFGGSRPPSAGPAPVIRRKKTEES